MEGCEQCRNYIETINLVKNTLQTFEINLENKQNRLNYLMFTGVVTKVIRQRLDEIEQDRIRLDGMIRTLDSIYTNYEDHLMNDHDDED